jgi:hypothetical protein
MSASLTELAKAARFAPPRLDGRAARALDRLARRAHAFHRFAHHPLCGRYASELVRLGRRERVCRGCAALGLGFLAGLVLTFTFEPSVPVIDASLGAGAALGVASLWLRLPKLLGRFLPALGLALAFASALTHFRSYVWLAGACGFGLAFVAYRRRGPSRTPCVSCPERLERAPCSGFAPIVRRERAFQRAARKLIATASVRL